MHHKKCKNGGFRAFSLKQNVVVRCDDYYNYNSSANVDYYQVIRAYYCNSNNILTYDK